MMFRVKGETVRPENYAVARPLCLRQERSTLGSSDLQFLFSEVVNFHNFRDLCFQKFKVSILQLLQSGISQNSTLFLFELLST